MQIDMTSSEHESGKSEKGEKAQGQEAREVSVWEWIVAGIGMVIVVSTIGILLYDTTLPKTPPDVTVRMTAVHPMNSQFLVTFEAVNNGGEGATGVTVEGELQSGDGVSETRETTIDFLPAGSTGTGGLYFVGDPQQGELELRAVGYQDP
jgi:uncharacterized protein (TIGR02588 family)